MNQMLSDSTMSTPQRLIFQTPEFDKFNHIPPRLSISTHETSSAVDLEARSSYEEIESVADPSVMGEIAKHVYPAEHSNHTIYGQAHSQHDPSNPNPEKEEHVLHGFLDLVNRASSFWVNTFHKKSEKLKEQNSVTEEKQPLKINRLNTQSTHFSDLEPHNGCAVGARARGEEENCGTGKRWQNQGLFSVNPLSNQALARSEMLRKREEMIKSKWGYKNEELLVKLNDDTKEDWRKFSSHYDDQEDSPCSPRFIKDRCKTLREPLLPKKTRFTHEEDLKIGKYYKRYGTNWKAIANYLPGRTPIMIKNRFYSCIRKKNKLPALLAEVSQKDVTNGLEDNVEHMAINSLKDIENVPGDIKQTIQHLEKALYIPTTTWKIEPENFISFDNGLENELRDRISSPTRKEVDTITDDCLSLHQINSFHDPCMYLGLSGKKATVQDDRMSNFNFHDLWESQKMLKAEHEDYIRTSLHEEYVEYLDEVQREAEMVERPTGKGKPLSYTYENDENNKMLINSSSVSTHKPLWYQKRSQLERLRQSS